MSNLNQDQSPVKFYTLLEIYIFSQSQLPTVEAKVNPKECVNTG